MRYQSCLLTLAAFAICCSGACGDDTRDGATSTKGNVARRMIVITPQKRIAYAADELDAAQSEARFSKDCLIVRCDAFDLALPDGARRAFHLHCTGDVTVQSADFAAQANSLAWQGEKVTLQGEQSNAHWQSLQGDIQAVSAKAIHFDWSNHKAIQVEDASSIEFQPKKP